jgi:hypothetical protein
MFSDTLLNQKRLLTDPTADMVVKTVFESGNYQFFSRLMAQMQRNDQVIPDDLPEVVKTYFEETQTLPAWANPKLIKQGHDFFARHAQSITSILGYYALPYCYAAANGAEVLWLSQKIRSNTTQRLLETGQFLLEVMAKNAFEPQGLGIRSIQKVRLMHAAVRFHVLKSGSWDMIWGQPVNQEDMAGTNLAFSFISLKGLDKLGISYTREEAEAFLHLWKVIGFMLGIDLDLLPETLKEIYILDKKISSRHFKKSEAGIGLTKALIDSFGDFIPNPALKSLIPGYLRFMLGKEVADLLEVPQVASPLLDSLWFGAIKAFNVAGNSLGGFSDTQQVIHALALQLQQQNAQRTDFQMPERLNQH